MINQPFFVEFLYKNAPYLAEIKPCCDEDNVYYYDLYVNNKYQYTITPAIDEQVGLTWKIALKNADKDVDKELVEAVGREIEKHLFE